MPARLYVPTYKTYILYILCTALLSAVNCMKKNRNSEAPTPHTTFLCVIIIIIIIIMLYTYT